MEAILALESRTWIEEYSYWDEWERVHSDGRALRRDCETTAYADSIRERIQLDGVPEEEPPGVVVRGGEVLIRRVGEPTISRF